MNKIIFTETEGILMKSEKKPWFTYLSLIFISGILTILDQWTKQLAVIHLQNQPDFSLIPGVLSFHYLENRGAAFGVFQNRQILFLIMTTAILLFILYALWKMPQEKKYRPLRLLSYFITAGAIGNLIDRVRLGYVVDFIYFSLIDFPVFNVADILVVAIGRANFIKKEDVKDGAVIVDIGINRMEDGKLCGDVLFEEVKDKASYISPVPGGVGQMTVAELGYNTYKAHIIRMKED